MEETNENLIAEISQLKGVIAQMKESMCFMGELIGGGDVKILAGATSKMSLSVRQATDFGKAYIVKNVWPIRKVLVVGWEMYSTEEGTFCLELLKFIRHLIPKGWNEIIFWHVAIVPMVRHVYNKQRAKATRKMKKTAMGECVGLSCCLKN